MSGPWEKYQDGPWRKYGAAPTADPFKDPMGDVSSQKEAAWLGAGKAVADTGRGIKQAATEAWQAFHPLQTLERVALGQPLQSDQLRAEQDAVNKRDASLMAQPGANWGYGGMKLGLSIPAAFIPGANTAMGAAITGLGMGAAEPQGVNGSRAESALAGMAGSVAGQAGGQALGEALARRAAQRAMTRQAAQVGGQIEMGPGQVGANALVEANPTATARTRIDYGTVDPAAQSGLTAAQRQAMRRGQDLGMRFTPGQATGNRSLQRLEAKASSQPWSSGTFDNININNERVVTREFLRSIGEQGNDLTPDVLRRATERIGRVFDHAAENNATQYTGALEARLSALEQQAAAELVPNAEGQVATRTLNNIVEMAARGNGVLEGPAFQAVRRNVNNLVNGSNPALAQWARGVRDALDEALLQSVGPEQAAALGTARQQWRILATARDRLGALSQSGKVNARTLANALTQGDARGMLMGANRSGLYDALRAVQAFPDIVGNSGTATRMPMSLTELGLALPTRIATGAYASTPAVRMAMGAQAAGGLLNDAGSQFGGLLAPYLGPAGLIGGGLLGPYALQK